jgi:subtilisin family serine protease
MVGTVRKRWLGIFALCIIVCSGGAATSRRAEAQATPAAPPDEYVIVQYASAVSAQALRADGQSPSLEEQGFRAVPVPKGQTKAQYLASLAHDPNVLTASDDATVYATDVPDDPYYLQYQAGYLTQIGLPAAWDIETGSNQVIVAVLDSGIDLSHPDFAGRLWENPNDSFSDGVDHDGNGCINDRYGCRFINLTTQRATNCHYGPDYPTATPPPGSGAVSDDAPNGHGTAVAGLIGANGNNNLGVAGVAWNVRLMTVKVLDCGSDPATRLPSGDMFNVAQGIDYARRMGARIINLSLSSASPVSDTPAIRAAIQSAQNDGVIIVTAAGNYGETSQPGPGYPGAYDSYPNLVTVGAADQNNGMQWAPFSSYGPALDFAAPGATGMVSTGRNAEAAYVTLGKGTSYATPVVSGMFALMMSRNSRLNAAQYIQIARDTATPAPPAPHGLNWAGAGIINIGAAVARVPMTISGTALRDWKNVPGGTEVRATVDGNDCGAATTASIGQASPFAIEVKSAAERPGCGAPGKMVQLTVAGAAAQPLIPWGLKNQNLGLINREVSSVSPPPGAVVVQTLNGSWSNIAQFDDGGSLPTAVGSLPTPWTAIYHWNPAVPSFDGTAGAFDRYLKGVPSYVNSWTTIHTYDTFWVDAPATNIASLNPNPQPGRVLPLKKGWNNFVYTGDSKAVKDALDAIAGSYTEVLQYDNASRTWLVYAPGQPTYLQDFGGLFKLKVYWIYMTADGAITMN